MDSPPRGSKHSSGQGRKPSSKSGGGVGATLSSRSDDSTGRRPSSNTERKLYDPNHPSSNKVRSQSTAANEPAAFAPRILSSVAKTDVAPLEFVDTDVLFESRNAGNGSREKSRSLNAFEGRDDGGSTKRKLNPPRSSARPEETRGTGILAVPTGLKQKPTERLTPQMVQPEVDVNVDPNRLDLKDSKDVKLLYKVICKLEDTVKSRNNETALEISDIEERLRLAKLFKTMIIAQPTLSQTHDLENRMWKVNFHARIEQLRRSNIQLADESTLNAFNTFIEGAIQIYTDMADGMKEGKEKTPSTPRWFRCVGYQGDLSRYKIMMGDPGKKKDWKEVKEIYEYAAFLAPSNGLYYHQLATISAMESNFMAAFFDFVRSLNVRAPYSSSKDTLLLLFVSSRKSLESKKRTSIELKFLTVYEILYTKISVDMFKIHMKSLRDALLGKSRPAKPDRWHIHVTVLTIHVLGMYTPANADETSFYEKATDGEKDMRNLIASFAAGIFESLVMDAALAGRNGGILESKALVAVRLVVGWLRTKVGKMWTMSSYFEPHYSLWQAFARLSRSVYEVVHHQEAQRRNAYNVDVESDENSQSSVGATPSSVLESVIAAPDSIRHNDEIKVASIVEVFAEDWMMRGLLPLREIYDRKVFDAAVMAAGGVKAMDEFFAEKVKYFPASGGEGEGRRRGKVLLNEFMEAFKEIPFMDVDTETGEIVYVGRRYQDVDTWRPPSDLDDQEPTTPSNPSLTHVLAPRMSTPLANAVKRIDDDDGEAGQLSVSASSFSHTARRMDDEDEEEIVMDFHEMMGFSSYGMDTGEAQLSPPDEAGLLVRELKQKKEELSLQLNSRGGVVDSDGDSGRRRMPSYQFIPKVLQDVSRDGGKVVLDLDKNKSQLLFDTNCYVGDLDGVKEMVGLGWSIVVPLAIIMELDGLSASEVEHLAISAGDALGYLEGMFVPGGGKPSNVMLITAQNTVLPFLTIRTEEWGSGVRGVDDVLVRCARMRGKTVLVSEDVNMRLKARGTGCVTASMDEVCVAILGRKYLGGGRKGGNSAAPSSSTSLKSRQQQQQRRSRAQSGLAEGNEIDGSFLDGAL